MIDSMYTFFCDRCGVPRLSVKHTVRITKDGRETTSDTCDICDTVQEIETTNDEEVQTRNG